MGKLLIIFSVPQEQSILFAVDFTMFLFEKRNTKTGTRAFESLAPYARELPKAI